MKQVGKLFIIAGPAGVGKNAIAAKLFEKLPELRRTVTATTRSPRAGEVNGKAYYFLTPEEFEACISKKDFIEWVWFAGFQYGTLREPIMESLNDGHDQLIVIDIRGAKVFKENFPNLVSIFVLPPKFKDLRDRMIARGQNTLEQIEDKLEIAKEEMTHQSEFDHVVVNDDLNTAVDEIAKLVRN